MKNSVFISYSRRDKPFVQRLVKAFNDVGRDVWIDWEDIPPMADWRGEIHAGIDNADDFVFVISPDSVESEVCGQELARAVAANKRLVPLMYREVTDYKAIHDALSAHNWIFFNDEAQFDVKFGDLLKALDTDLEHTRAHTRLLNRAMEWDKKGRNASFALRGQDLQDAERWYASAGEKFPRPTELQSAYIYASRQAAEARRRFTLFVLAGGLVASLLLTLFAVTQSTAAREANTAAQTARLLAEQQEANARSLLLADRAQQSYVNNEVELAIALALEANQVGDPPAQSQLILSEVAYSPGVRKFYSGHETSVNSVAISPDGRAALTGSFDGTSVFWDMETGEERNRFITPNRMPIRGVAFNPARPNEAVAALWDWSIVIWDTATGEQLARLGGIRTGVGHNGVVTSLAISADGATLLSASNDGTLIQWDLTTGEPLQRYGSYDPESGNGRALLGVSISPDGRYAVSGGLENVVTLWDLATGEVRYQMVGHRDDVLTVAYSPDGATVVSGSKDSTLILWSAETGRKLTEFDTGHTAPVRSVTYTPDSATIISAAEDGSIIVWDAAGGAKLRELGGIDRRIQELSLAVTGDGRRVLAGSSNGRLTIWDITNEAVEQYYEGHRDFVNSVEFSPDERRALTASTDNTLMLWDVATGDILATLEGHDAAVNRAVFRPDGVEIASGGDDGRVLIWDAATGAPLRDLDAGDAVTGLAYTRDGASLLVATYSDGLFRLNPSDGTVEREYTGHTRRVLTLAVSPDGESMATSGADGTIIVWDIASGAITRRHERANGAVRPSRVLALAYHPGGDGLLFGTLAGELSLWNLAGNRIETFDRGDYGVWSLAFSPDGRFAVSGLADGTLTLWDVETAGALRRFREHRSNIMAAQFNAAGDRVITASRDTTALLWDMPTLDTLLAWTRANRYVLPLNCDQRAQYRLDTTDCAAQLAQQGTTVLSR
jgi:WD40 repeat protein